MPTFLKDATLDAKMDMYRVFAIPLEFNNQY